MELMNHFQTYTVAVSTVIFEAVTSVQCGTGDKFGTTTNSQRVGHGRRGYQHGNQS